MYGAGNPHAELMIVGEAPGHHEDRTGDPIAGQVGELLDRLLAGIGLTRDDVYVANALKCRPPRNRDPLPEEIEACEPHLYRQIELVRPTVVATLGNFATRLLSGRPVGITRVHGQETELVVAGRTLVLYPLYHPAAALYTPSMLAVLEQDFSRLPALLGAPAVEHRAIAGRRRRRAGRGRGRTGAARAVLTPWSASRPRRRRRRPSPPRSADASRSATS